jgi:hypothetical protein
MHSRSQWEIWSSGGQLMEPLRERRSMGSAGSVTAGWRYWQAQVA